jgi:hypothetical protein
VVEGLDDLADAELDLDEVVEGDEAGTRFGRLGGGHRAGGRWLGRGRFVRGGRFILHAMDLPSGLLYILLTLLR